MKYCKKCGELLANPDMQCCPVCGGEPTFTKPIMLDIFDTDSSGERRYNIQKIKREVLAIYNDPDSKVPQKGKFVVLPHEIKVTNDICTVTVRFQSQDIDSMPKFVEAVSVHTITGACFIKKINKNEISNEIEKDTNAESDVNPLSNKRKCLIILLVAAGIWAIVPFMLGEYTALDILQGKDGTEYFELGQSSAKMSLGCIIICLITTLAGWRVGTRIMAFLSNWTVIYGVLYFGTNIAPLTSGDITKPFFKFFNVGFWGIAIAFAFVVHFSKKE